MIFYFDDLGIGKMFWTKAVDVSSIRLKYLVEVGIYIWHYKKQ